MIEILIGFFSTFFIILPFFLINFKLLEKINKYYKLIFLNNIIIILFSLFIMYNIIQIGKKTLIGEFVVVASYFIFFIKIKNKKQKGK